MTLKFEKSFDKFVEYVETNPLICNTLHFDQYSRLNIRSNIFLFSANNSKNEFESWKNCKIGKKKKNFSLVCRARCDESIDA